jgi:dynein heavy chain
MAYDKDNISAATIRKMESTVLNDEAFNYQSAEKCSFALKFLYLWCKAMVDYYQVFTETKPLREKLIQMRKIVEEK